MLSLFFSVAVAHTHSHSGLQEWLLHLFGLSEENPWAEAAVHFIYDLGRVLLVFFVVLFLVSFLQTYVTMDRLRDRFSHMNPFLCILIALLLGLLASTCICTNIPIFIGLIAMGVPLYASMTFLISSSLLNISSILSMLAINGAHFTGVYTITAIVITYIAGLILALLRQKDYLYHAAIPEHTAPEHVHLHGHGCTCNHDHPISHKHLAADHVDSDHAEHTHDHSESGCAENHNPNQCRDFASRCRYAWHQTGHAFREQWLYILLGVAISAGISAFVNLDFVQQIAELGWISVLAVTVIGLFLHTDVISILPVAQTLFSMGAGYGLLLPLIFSLAFFSLPTIVMLNKVVKIRYIGYTWGIMFILILGSGFVWSLI
ncbi:MAG TPA: permease [Firmicutes bacterium]|nr:permease [Bacillota bacterium]